MQVFPVFSSFSAKNGSCCVFSADESGEHLRFHDENGAPLPRLRIGTEPGGTHLLCEGQITGGTFAEYLAALEPEHTCLFLERIRLRFPLPCQDGEGLLMEEDEYTDTVFRFSPELGTRWALRGTEMLLCDDAASLRYRFRAAEAAGIALLIAEPDVLRDAQI